MDRRRLPARRWAERRRVLLPRAGAEAGAGSVLPRICIGRSLDSSRIDLLTPENANHDISLSPSGAYFVDSYSKLDAVPISVVRRADLDTRA